MAVSSRGLWKRHAVRGQRFKPEGIAQRGEGEVDVV